ncbi:hypothetical protein GEMRC1_005650 [Eukaryota sp. GEM-RC1]
MEVFCICQNGLGAEGPDFFIRFASELVISVDVKMSKLSGSTFLKQFQLAKKISNFSAICSVRRIQIPYNKFCDVQNVVEANATATTEGNLTHVMDVSFFGPSVAQVVKNLKSCEEVKAKHSRKLLQRLKALQPRH